MALADNTLADLGRMIMNDANNDEIVSFVGVGIDANGDHHIYNASNVPISHIEEIGAAALLLSELSAAEDEE